MNHDADKQAREDSGLPGRSVERQEEGAVNCERNAQQVAEGTLSSYYGSESHWLERAQAHHRSAALLRGEAIETAPLALVETDLGISYAHVNCENAQASGFYTAPVCRCQYTHAYAFAAFDLGHLKSVKGADYRRTPEGR